MLQEMLGLPVRDVPVISVISRVVQHKGYDILIESLKDLLYERVKEIHTKRFPYNDFLFEYYDEEQ